MAQPRVHSDERDAPVQPVWPRLTEAGSRGILLVRGAEPRFGHHWQAPQLGPGSDHRQLLPSSWDPPPARRGLLPNGMPQGGRSQPRGRLPNGWSIGAGGASRTLHGFASPAAKAAEISFLSWFESRVRGAKRRLLAGWKTGERERKRRLRPWSNVQSRLSFSLGSDYQNPVWCTECSFGSRQLQQRFNNLKGSKNKLLGFYYYLLARTLSN